MTAAPAYFCAAANLLAALALATVLAPGTTLASDAARAAYVRENVVAWQLGWGLWIVAAISLLVFYRWWTARVGASVVPLAIATAGFAADILAESLLIAFVPDLPSLARGCFLLTGGVANGCYSVAGTLLSLRTPQALGRLAPWTAAVWLSGFAISAFAFLEVPFGIAVSTALLFALFLPWLIVVGRRLA